MLQVQKLKALKKTIRLIFLLIFLLICLSFSFALLVIKDFSQPLDGIEDLGIWEYMGYYFSKNLKILPLPNLDLTNNQVFYPYGTNSVFQGWGIEKDTFYAVLYLLFGIGAWLQIYYFFTILAIVIGTFLLLFRDYGIQRAAGAAVIVSFGNFYAVQKYPIHFDNAVIHWTTLSFIADFLIVKRVTLRQSIPLSMILVRACLLILSFGQGLGYIAGFALVSFTVSTVFVTTLLIYRYFRYKQKFSKLFKSLLETYKQDFLKSPHLCLFLLIITSVIGYLYLPLALEIAKEAKSFDFREIPMGAWWTNPLRLFVPLLPPGLTGLMPSYYELSEVFAKIFRDSPAGSLPGSPGLFLAIIGVLGLWQARKKAIIFIPLIIVFLLCLSYNPEFFPTLRIFPWFAFNRFTERSTNIYPVILCLLALHINLNNLPLILKKILPFLLVILACTELYTAYYVKFNYQPYSFDKTFFAYMDYVKKTPGEAVLDFPFCAVGGNGVGGTELCPYYLKTAGIYGLRRFHEKKVLGQYFGRLHPSQIQPYLQAGWNKLFFPDNPSPHLAVSQTRCFRADEWAFFTDFYKLNDFAGINLYVDLLPRNCASEFYERFGNPAVETVVPGAGRVKFLPKSTELRNQVNLELGTALKFEPFLSFSESNLIKPNSEKTFLAIRGLNPLAKDTISDCRWGLGPESKLEFKLPQSQTLAVSFRFDNPIPGQDVVVEANGATILRLERMTGGNTVDKTIKFQGVKGLNYVTFKYRSWNHNKIILVPNYNQPIAVLFRKLLIQPE
ncbi:hypothetical protein H6F96_17470 [Microcoleus sp. FACHB-53]|nr:hypothetical protein [Microcoleus sp. FACHB-53]MBD2127280.1 hypothetical protein [Microcoleus sp. FACHB-1]